MATPHCPHCGCVVDHCAECGGALSKPRSVLDHNRYFAMIARAFFHWPASSPFQPESAEHLRAWLQCEVGHCTIDYEKVPAIMTKVPGLKQVVEMFLRRLTHAVLQRDAEYVFTEVLDDGTCIIKRPKSIARREMPAQKDFTALREKVSDLIEATTGVSVEELLATHVA